MCWLMSSTLSPVTSESVRQLFISGRPNLRLRGVVGIEMDFVRVAGQQREPGVVRLAQGPSHRMVVDLADLEVFEEPSAFRLRHSDTSVP